MVTCVGSEGVIDRVMLTDALADVPEIRVLVWAAGLPHLTYAGVIRL